jgi:membrane-associated phospholipid phosphatase
MMETLLQLDKEILYLINVRWANGFFDAVMPWTRLKYNWLPLYAVLIGNILLTYKKKAWIPLLICIGAVAISDQIASSLLKPYFHRMRPCQNTLLPLRTVIDCGSGFSFVSSHAANHFAVAVTYPIFFRHQTRWFWPALLFWAALVSYAQVYVGYHYPSDVIAGAALGIAVASVILLLLRKQLRELEVLELTQD